MTRDARSVLLRYGGAVVLTGLATLLRWALGHWVIGANFPYVTFVLTAAAVAWYAGFGPAVIAACLGGLIGTSLWVTSIPGNAGRVTSLVIYLLVSLSVSGLIEAMRRQQLRAEENIAALDENRKLLSASLASIELAQDALRKSESQLRTVLRALPVGVWFTDAAGKIVLDNPAGQQIWSGRRDSGGDIHTGYEGWWAATGSPVAADEWGLARALVNGEVTLNEVIDIGAFDGTRKIILNSVLPVRDDGGELLGAIVVNEDVTARRRAEEALRESVARFELVAEASGIGFWYSDLPFGELAWDARVREHFGVSPEAAVAIATLYERLHPDDRERTREAIERCIAGLDKYDIDYRTVGPDGRLRWIHSVGRTLRDGDGVPIRFDGITIDITERKRTEEALRASEERFRLLADSAPAMVWMSGTDGLCNFFNKPWMDFTGRSMEAERGNGWAENIHPEDLQRCLDSILSSMDGRRPFKVEFRLRRFDGIYRWVLSHGVPLLGAGGDFAGYIGSCIDITERREAEDVMAFAASIVESSDDAIIGKRLDGSIVSWNGGAERLYGYRADEVLGKNIRILAEPGVDDIETILDQLREGKRYHHYEAVRVKKSGERVDVALTVSPIKDGNGRITGASTIARDITTQKRAELEQERLLAENEQQRTRLNNIVANVPGVVWEAWGQPDSAAQRINFVSEYVESMLGYSVEEWLSSPNFWLTIVHPEDRDLAARIAAGRFASGKGSLNQFRWLTKDGRAIWVEAQSLPIYDEHGNTVGLRGVTMDISERKRAEEERSRFLAEQQEHSERLQKIAEAALAINSTRSPDDLLHLVTEQARHIIGAHQSITSLVAGPEGAEPLHAVSLSEKYAAWRGHRGQPNPAIDWQACETNQPIRMTQAELAVHPTCRSLAAGTERRPPMRGWLAAPLVGRDGRNLGLIQLSDKYNGDFTPEDESIIVQLAQMASVAFDNQRLIAAEQRARAAAEAGERHSRFLAEASAALASSLDYETTLTDVARSAVPRLADWCSVHIAEDGKHLRQLTLAHSDPKKLAWARELSLRYPADPNAALGAMSVFRTGKPEFYANIDDSMLVQSARDQEHLGILREFGMKSAMVVPLTSRSRTLGVMTFLAAESNRHYTQSDLVLAEDLARRAALAVDSALLFAEAHRARAQAEEANRMKDEFLATVSHELRTPLSAIVGWAHMLRTRSFDEATTARALETIERNAKSQAQIIEDILDVSRIITGKLRLDVRPVDLAPIIEAALDSMRPAAEAKEISLQAILDPVAGPVPGDASRLQQVVWNLVSNAVKFTSKGGRVQVRLKRVKSHVEIVVSDTGQGMRAELLPFIFDRFRQGDSTSTRMHGGLGLGLAIVRHLVELHGGTVVAESPGEELGATFTVKLPLMPMQSGFRETLSPASEAMGDKPPGDPPSLRGIKVLVIDDEPDTREILKTMIEEFGAQVKTCESGPVALTTLDDWRPEVIVSDIEMPGEDGYQMMQQIRRLAPERGGRTAAVALTAYARPDDRMRALAAGYQMHLAKPADPIELAIVIASLAGRDGSLIS